MAIIPVKWTPNISSKFTTMAFNMHQSGKVEDDFSFNKKKTSGILRLTNNFVLFRKNKCRIFGMVSISYNTRYV